MCCVKKKKQRQFPDAEFPVIALKHIISFNLIIILIIYSKLINCNSTSECVFIPLTPKQFYTSDPFFDAFITM